MDIQNVLLTIFSVVIGGFLIADLGFFNKKAHKIEPKSALIQSLFWIAMAFAFAFLVFLYMGREPAVEFMSAYVTEKMLSVDNLFVIMLIFNFFKIEEKFHHKVLFWGILGAIIFRGIFILVGALIIQQFAWILYIFGLILLYTGFKLFVDKKEEHVDFEQSRIVKLARKYLPFSKSYHSGKFIIWENGKMHFTILFLIVLLVEATDIIFAIDSIPAAFAITQKPFIVFTSNIFAIMGLRALFFLLESVLHRFHHLQKGLAFVLIFIGAKMLLGIFHLHISSLMSFLIIVGVFALSMILSTIFPKKL
ncbi:TerC/Alx family metal homeostasis membrane protein [Candidatus Woesebacteria bacterium]|jgi:tellurite resistance protein TerC|nr:TerC/Alx family metal homeostasis membrane protein [Candidatus Woesebacteria bacterium]